MNGECLGGTCNNLGSFVGGKYEISDECEGKKSFLL